MRLLISKESGSCGGPPEFMRTIVNVEALHSGLHPGFEHVHTMVLEGPIFASGNFGDVYEALSINGMVPSPPQAVKILRADGSGSDWRGFEAIQKLQRKILESNARRAEELLASLESLPALCALPQFSFRGEENGEQVMGYSANRLDIEGYLPFATVLEDDQERERYNDLSFEDRMLLATELVEGFQALEEMSFIHADINAPNLLIDIERRRLAIIDYDSGAVMDNRDDRPTTFGKRDDWLAPEIVEQMGKPDANGVTVKVDRFTDRWSVFIGIHYLLFLCHPLFFFNGLLNRQSVGGYLAIYDWPEISPVDPLFDPDAEEGYLVYRQLLGEIPESVMAKLRVTLNEGFTNPSRRTSYQQWALTLRAAQRAPEIAYFVSDEKSIVAGMQVRLSWSVSGAAQVFIDGVGAVDADGATELFPQESRSYQLTARARNGKSVSANLVIRVWPVPTLKTLQVPTVSIRSRVILKALQNTPPRIHVPVSLNLATIINKSAPGKGASELFDEVRARRPALPSNQVRRQTGTAGIFRQLKENIGQLRGEKGE